MMLYSMLVLCMVGSVQRARVLQFCNVLHVCRIHGLIRTHLRGSIDCEGCPHEPQLIQGAMLSGLVQTLQGQASSTILVCK